MNRNEAGLTEIRHNLRKPIVSEIATIEKCCPKLIFLTMKGGFQLLDLIITELKSHVKVHIFLEGHKIWRNLHLTFVLCSASQK